MADVRPFRPLRPRDDLAGQVIAPPYDVLSVEQACALAENRRSFVRVTRSEVDLPAGADPHSDEAYAMARSNLDALRAEEVLVLDDGVTTFDRLAQIGECKIERAFELDRLDRVGAAHPRVFQ